MWVGLRKTIVYGVIGLGQLGEAAALQLQESGHDVIVADIDMGVSRPSKKMYAELCAWMQPMNMRTQPPV